MLKREFSSYRGMLRQLVKDYKWLIIAGLILFLPSIMIYAAKPTILPYCNSFRMNFAEGGASSICGMLKSLLFL